MEWLRYLRDTGWDIEGDCIVAAFDSCCWRLGWLIRLGWHSRHLGRWNRCYWSITRVGSGWNIHLGCGRIRSSGIPAVWTVGWIVLARVPATAAAHVAAAAAISRTVPFFQIRSVSAVVHRRIAGTHLCCKGWSEWQRKCCRSRFRSWRMRCAETRMDDIDKVNS